MHVKVVLLSVVVVLGVGRLAQAADAPSYARDVKPFLAKYCAECHNNTKAKSGYNVESFESLTKKGKKGVLVVPEEPDKSLLIRTMDGKGKAMPPRKSAQPKTDEVAKVRQWIKDGARDDTPPADDEKKKRDGNK